MAQTLIVIHRRKDWEAYYPSEQVITFADYMNSAQVKTAPHTRIINLCRNFGYLTEGYYCSLLAEARGHKVIPSVQTLSDLGKRALYRLHLDDFSETVNKSLQQADVNQPIVLKSFFGHTADTSFNDLSQKLFEAFPCPILEITLRYRKIWEISGLKPLSPAGLDEPDETFFAEALDTFSRGIWRKATQPESVPL